jgi:MSHA biogenesis protein MshQ
MGESFAAQFSLLAQNANNQSTSNYQGAYAYLNPAGAGNPLGFAALSGATNLSSRLVASAAVTGTFGGTGSSTVVAPLTINRAVSADGPFTAVMLGIAPMDADGIVMGGGSTYDISVAGGLADHTSIMDPATQSSITVRYGRSKISNAYGSEMLPLMVPIALQYWNGTTYVTATDDANTRLSASNVSLNSTLGSLTSAFGTSATGTCQPTPLPSALTLTNGAGKFCLLKPGVSGTVTLSANAPSYLLPGISGIAKFGVYKSPLIYRRENY